VREREALYEFVCEKHPLHVGKTLSTRERDSQGLAASTLVYGEIKFEPFAISLMKIKALYGGLKGGKGGKFIDVGSGTGKPVFAAAVVHDWESCRGIEILTGLHAASLEILERWKTPEVQAKLPEGQRGIAFDLIRGDATAIDWSDADVVFMNSTCFDEALMLKLVAVADKMAVGSFGVTFTKPLPSARWKVLENEVFAMSWGSATVFIQMKILP
jgi:hypothetical protein